MWKEKQNILSSFNKTTAPDPHLQEFKVTHKVRVCVCLMHKNWIHTSLGINKLDSECVISVNILKHSVGKTISKEKKNPQSYFLIFIHNKIHKSLCQHIFKSAHSFDIFWVFTEETGNNHGRPCTTGNKMDFATRLHIQIRGNPRGRSSHLCKHWRTFQESNYLAGTEGDASLWNSWGSHVWAV